MLALVARRRVIVCAGTGCAAGGALKVLDAFRAVNADVTLSHEACPHREISKSGCQGFCQMGPLVTVLPENIFYTRVTPADVPEIGDRTLVHGETVDRLLYRDPATKKPCRGTDDIPFYQRQTRYVLKDCGYLDPESIDEYLAGGGYLAAKLAYTAMTPIAICAEITKSGLRGRGGGGFPTGRKWETARVQNSPKKYVICNGDEGDPGAFMDRSVLESDPHRVLEGMLIAGYAVGATEAYIYVRAEYPLAIKRLRNAIRQAERVGLLGSGICGTRFSFKIDVRLGAGAFVCGEETALIASVEGKRGTPRPRPPYPAMEGLFGQPTLINNVETFANIAPIIRNGGDWYAGIGTEKSKGTKVFALAGRVANTGLVEVPMGISLREMVFEIGGGIPDGRKFKAVQTGGPSGGCLPTECLDMPVDYESLAKAGSIMGSGGMIVMDESSCMVDVAKYFMDFCMTESCGKCIPCRVGTYQMHRILTAIGNMTATEQDLKLLEELCDLLKHTSLCGLGQSAPNPVVSTLKSFAEEYRAHIQERKCPAGVCGQPVGELV
jgi:NADH:ubiquinone oxidoreductase subunit F (NADH-binding)/(2Fe-2S) ferredoxin